MFKQAGMKRINVNWVDPTKPNIAVEITNKFTTKTDGLSILIRGMR